MSFSIKLCIATLIALSMAGCIGNSKIIHGSKEIKFGMHTSALINLMGNPTDKQFQGNSQAWQWCAAGAGILIADYNVLVWIEKDLVIGMQTYNKLPGGWGCQFRMIKWEEKPNKTLEIRVR